ncbi:DNA cytosine methyltransferase [Nostoc sp. UHCC 0251]|uniref:DNA cytosine methyltransferase n=1 Tax=Nostoc sp. UHCC 0251 TaxID=3110240 RepID=UPI002B20D38F|nr:DNA cytosine methyltransferase [Nostoc sp. UHCC 0251]MEA5625833.1 DNA cytosine methyltransferase [Nostoc sp. UHCC 0251]
MKIEYPTVLDIFCGAGGMSLGFQNAGCQILGGIDNNPHAIRTHHRNFPNCRLELDAQDVRNVDFLELPIKPGEVDILIGGPPCQGFSVVGIGKMKSLERQRGNDPELKVRNDPRNFLYKIFIDFLNYYQPIFFVIENVNTLKSNKIFPTIIRELENGLPVHQHDYPGYDLFEPRVLIASDYGVPQLRKRLFIVGKRKNTNLSFEFPQRNIVRPISVGDAIGDLPELKPVSMALRSKISGPKQVDVEMPYNCPPQSEYQEKMRIRKQQGEGVMNHICRAHNEKDLAIFEMLTQGGKYRDLPESVRRYRSDIFNDKYKRLKWNEPSWTLTAHMQRDCLAYIHPTQTRSLSVREAARLQSFPDDFVFDAPMTRMFELVGNSVPPFLAEAIARPIVEQIKAYKASH